MLAATRRHGDRRPCGSRRSTAAPSTGRPGASVSVTRLRAAVPHRATATSRSGSARPEAGCPSRAHEPVPDLPIGSEVRASGMLAPPRPWEADYLARFGIASARAPGPSHRPAAPRGGLGGRRRRRPRPCRGRPRRAACPTPRRRSCAGFVLGQDDRIDPATVDDFQRSGPRPPPRGLGRERDAARAARGRRCSALSGIPLRTRLGRAAGPDRRLRAARGRRASIQRAGVMGAAGVVAALAGRPALAVVRAAPRGHAHPRAQPASPRRPRLAAQLRRGRSGILLFAARSRDLILGGRRRRMGSTIGRPSRPRRGRGRDDRRHPRDRAPVRTPTSAPSRSRRCPRTCWRSPPSRR